MPRTPIDTEIKDTIDRFYNSKNLPPPKVPPGQNVLTQIAIDLYCNIVSPLDAANSILPSYCRYPTPKGLPVLAVAETLNYFYYIKCVNCGGKKKTKMF